MYKGVMSDVGPVKLKNLEGYPLTYVLVFFKKRKRPRLYHLLKIWRGGPYYITE